MAKPFEQIPGHLLYSTHVALSKAGGDETHADWIRSGDNAALLVEFIDRQRAIAKKNPFSENVVRQILALRRANEEEDGWNLTEDDFLRLALTVPPRPTNASGFLNVQLSLRIRWGEGDEGVALTYLRHIGRLAHVLGKNMQDAEEFNDLESSGIASKDRIRLLSGNHTHKPVVEWVWLSLGANRPKRTVRDIESGMLYSETKIGDVRSSKALADELLVWAWINPKKVNPTLEGRQWVAAGYETRVTLVGGRSDPAPYLAEWSDTINLVSYNWKASVCTQQISSLMQFDQAVPEIIV